ncbi:hypothetical protein [Cellulomonas sp. ATA003]|uniref:hypothetical protein n=1 Tax=Cellulomonas sp. ATA003 TaxID=3073064 RepID=UPI00287337B0|nr:hypothetical protein [Cellulomonas sp. ATA003]WNB86938.1 hypothetical protein REH70_07210 [Cellulomonas sp. ATA003]
MLSIVAVAPRIHVIGYLIVGLPLSLIAAHLFYRWVEMPAHRLSRAAGRRAAAPLVARS